MTREQYLRDRETYFRLRAAIEREYPQEWFVAITDDKVLGAAEKFEQLVEAIEELERDLRDVSVAEVGKDYPEYHSILPPFRISSP
jgi:hypothetical protein